jgi:hypothetical protein
MKEGALLTILVMNKKNKKLVNGVKLKLLIYTGKKYKTVTLKTKTFNKLKGMAGYATNQLSVGTHKVKIISTRLIPAIRSPVQHCITMLNINTYVPYSYPIKFKCCLSIVFTCSTVDESQHIKNQYGENHQSDAAILHYPLVILNIIYKSVIK